MQTRNGGCNAIHFCLMCLWPADGEDAFTGPRLQTPFVHQNERDHWPEHALLLVSQTLPVLLWRDSYSFCRQTRKIPARLASHKHKNPAKTRGTVGQNKTSNKVRILQTLKVDLVLDVANSLLKVPVWHSVSKLTATKSMAIIHFCAPPKVRLFRSHI